MKAAVRGIISKPSCKLAIAASSMSREPHISLESNVVEIDLAAKVAHSNATRHGPSERRVAAQCSGQLRHMMLAQK
eukprot:5377376-Pyramimonas_sp.AAC.1